MKARKSGFGTLTVLGMATVFVLLTAINGEAQTAMQAPESHVSTARIPFDFWIGGANLPAGDYTLDFILDTLVLFRNAGANAQEQVFLMPKGETARSGEAKLIFIEQNHHHICKSFGPRTEERFSHGALPRRSIKGMRVSKSH